MKSWVVSLLIFFFFSLFVSHLLRGRREGVLGALIANQPYVLFFFCCCCVSYYARLHAVHICICIDICRYIFILYREAWNLGNRSNIYQHISVKKKNDRFHNSCAFWMTEKKKKTKKNKFEKGGCDKKKRPKKKTERKRDEKRVRTHNN